VLLKGVNALFVTKQCQVAKPHHIPVIHENRSPYLAQMGPLLETSCVPYNLASTLNKKNSINYEIWATLGSNW